MCWKLSYPSPQRAWSAALYYQRGNARKDRQRAYHCPRCHSWHLATNHPAPRRATAPAIEWED